MNQTYTNGMPGRDWDILNTKFTPEIINEVEQDAILMIEYLKDHPRDCGKSWLFKSGGMVLDNDTSLRIQEAFMKKLGETGSWILAMAGFFVCIVRLNLISNDKKSTLAYHLRTNNIRGARTFRENQMLNALMATLPYIYGNSADGLEDFLFELPVPDIDSIVWTPQTVKEVEEVVIQTLEAAKDAPGTLCDTWLFSAGGFCLLTDENIEANGAFVKKLNRSESWILQATTAYICTAKTALLSGMLAAMGHEKKQLYLADAFKESNLRKAKDQKENDFLDLLIAVLPLVYNMSSDGLEAYFYNPSSETSQSGSQLYDVVLTSYDEGRKLSLIKVIKDIYGLSLAEAKERVTSVPSVISYSQPLEVAARLVTEVNAAGGVAQIALSKNGVATTPAKAGTETPSAPTNPIKTGISSHTEDTKASPIKKNTTQPTTSPLGDSSNLSSIKDLFTKHAKEIRPEQLSILESKTSVLYPTDMITKDHQVENFVRDKLNYSKRIAKEKQAFESAKSEYEHLKSLRIADSERRRSEKAAKKKKRRKAFLKFLLFAAILGVLAWVAITYIYPNYILPAMDSDELYTPEIMQSYCYSEENVDVIITIENCTKDGRLSVVWEAYYTGGQYLKVNLIGKITSKKNNGDITIEWIDQTPEHLPDDITWTDEVSATIRDNYQTLITDSHVFSAGVNEEYAIQEPQDFLKLENSNGTYHLRNDIDLAGIDWIPIRGFTGTLVGNGYTIHNLTINNASSNVGFFSSLGGIVMNLKFEDARINVRSANENIGILCGELTGIAMNITTSGSVTATQSIHVGGIAGSVVYNGSHAMESLTNNASISGHGYVGGIFGGILNEGQCIDAVASFKNLINSGSISAADECVGGIFGYGKWNDTGSGSWVAKVTLESIKNTGNISGNRYVGGLFGYVFGETGNSILTNAQSSASISGEVYVGGLIGKAEYLTVQHASNENSTLVANGAISENAEMYAYVGGIAGYGYQFSNCTNSIRIEYTGDGKYVGGIAGYVGNASSHTMENLTNSADIFGKDCVGGIFGEIINEGQCIDAVASFKNLTNSGTIAAQDNYVGGIFGNGKWNDTGSGSWVARVTLENIKNTGNISGRQYVGGLFGYIFGETGSSILTGAQCNASITGSTYVGGLIGKAEYLTVQHASNENSTLIANGSFSGNAEKFVYAGGIAGYGYQFSDCTNSIRIEYTGDGKYVGGIAGYVNNAGSYTMENLANKADISGKDCVGGIFGGILNEGQCIDASASFKGLSNTGAITASGNYVGGIFGHGRWNDTGSGSWITKVMLEGVKNTGNISGVQFVGGLFGYIFGETGNSVLANAQSNASVTGSTYVGGLIGKAEYLVVKNASNENSTLVANGSFTENAEKLAYVGGIAGYGYQFSDCTNSISIKYTGDGRYVGGIAGYVSNASSHTMENLINNADISGMDYVGGIFGKILNEAQCIDAVASFKNLSNTGAISASGNYVGGIFGHGRWNDTGSGSWVAKVTLENIHNTSNISGKQYVGGLFGHIFGETDASYMFECTSSGKVTGSRRYGNIAGKRENIVEK